MRTMIVFQRNGTATGAYYFQAPVLIMAPSRISIVP